MAHKGIPSAECRQKLSAVEREDRTQAERVRRFAKKQARLKIKQGK